MSISDDVSRTSSSLWTTVSGEVAHPDSPRGGGGPGRFVGSGPLGAERMVPIHYDTFVNSDDLPGDCPRVLEAEVQKRGIAADRVGILAIGEQRVFVRR